jgi:hypothetical protein
MEYYYQDEQQARGFVHMMRAYTINALILSFSKLICVYTLVRGRGMLIWNNKSYGYGGKAYDLY